MQVLHSVAAITKCGNLAFLDPQGMGFFGRYFYIHSQNPTSTPQALDTSELVQQGMPSSQSSSFRHGARNPPLPGVTLEQLTPGAIPASGIQWQGFSAPTVSLSQVSPSPQSESKTQKSPSSAGRTLGRWLTAKEQTLLQMPIPPKETSQNWA